MGGTSQYDVDGVDGLSSMKGKASRLTFLDTANVARDSIREYVIYKDEGDTQEFFRCHYSF